MFLYVPTYRLRIYDANGQQISDRVEYHVLTNDFQIACKSLKTIKANTDILVQNDEYVTYQCDGIYPVPFDQDGKNFVRSETRSDGTRIEWYLPRILVYEFFDNQKTRHTLT